MNFKELTVSTIIKSITRTDNLFKGNYTLDPYQNCSFGCIYCDSSYEKTIIVKSNALDVLRKELPLIEKGRIIIGSVHDPYQEIENTFKLTHKILDYLQSYDFPIHILTKSIDVINDVSLLDKFSDVVVTFTLITTNEQISSIIESNAPSPMKRLETMKKIQKHGIKTGIALIPIIPFLTDVNLEEDIKLIKEYNAEYLLYRHLELKGDQKGIFYEFINNNFKEKMRLFEYLFDDHFLPNSIYINKIDAKIKKICKKYEIPNMIEFT